MLPAVFVGSVGFNELLALPQQSSSCAVHFALSSVCQGSSGAPPAMKGSLCIFLNTATQSLRSTLVQMNKWRIQLECFEIQFSRKALGVYNLHSAISKIHIYLTSASLQNFPSQYFVQGGSSTCRQDT